jgi:hypothetical protein
MVAPMNTCTILEKRDVVRFLWAKDVAAKDIHKEIHQQIAIKHKLPDNYSATL